MKTKPAKPPPVVALAGRIARPEKPYAKPASNAALNLQTRRVLAQHYRAKYGVK